MKKHNQLIKIIQDAVDQPYKYGTYDCNIVALRIVDLFACTNWAEIAKYKTLKGGLKQLKELGYTSTQEIIKQYADPVQSPIDGDLWLDPDSHNILIIVSGRELGVNTEHTQFQLNVLSKDGGYFRVRKQ